MVGRVVQVPLVVHRKGAIRPTGREAEPVRVKVCHRILVRSGTAESRPSDVTIGRRPFLLVELSKDLRVDCKEAVLVR